MFLSLIIPLLALSAQTPTNQSYPVNSGVVPPSAFTPPPNVVVGPAGNGGWTFAFQDYVLADQDGDLNTVHDQVLLNGNVLLKPFSIDLVFGTNPKVEIANTISTVVTLEIRGDYAASFGETIPLATIPLPIIPISGIIEVEPVLLLFVQLSGNVEANMVASFNRESEVRMGLQYYQGNVTAFSNPSVLSDNSSTPTVSGLLDITADIAAIAGTAFVPYVSGVPLPGPMLAGSASLGIQVSTMQSPWWSISGGFSVLSGSYDLVTGPHPGASLSGPNTTSLLSSTGPNTGSGTGTNTGWAKVYDFGVGTAAMAAVTAADGSGDLVVIGTKGLTSGFLLQTAENGTTSWVLESNRLLKDVDVSPNGEYYLAANSTTTTGGLVVKLDSAGNLLWERQLLSKPIELTGVTATVDGGVAVSGSVISNGASLWLVARFDANGNLMWAKQYENSSNEGARKIWELANGGFMVGGSSFFTVPGGTIASSNAAALRIDANGDIVWFRVIGGLGFDVAQGACPAGDGIMLVGAVEGEANVAWAIRLDGLGNLLWSRIYAGEERGSTFDTIGGDTPWDSLLGVVAMGGDPLTNNAGSHGFLLLGNTSLGADADAWAMYLGPYLNYGYLHWLRSFRGIDEDTLNIGLETSEGLLFGGTSRSWPIFTGHTNLSLMHSSNDGGVRLDRTLPADDLYELLQQEDTANVISVVMAGLSAFDAGLTASAPTLTITLTPVTPTETVINE